jgi:hypothetical protein
VEQHDVQGDHDWAVPWIMRKTVDYIKDRYNNFPQFITQTGEPAGRESEVAKP